MRIARALPGALLGAVVSLVVACEIGNTRVHDGQLYRTGEAAYDAYFRDVHELQVEAADFDIERREARKPLAEALDLTPDAADSTIVQVTGERIRAAAPQIGGAAKLDVDGDNAVVHTKNGSRGAPDTEKMLLAIEQSVKAEIARGKKLKDTQPKVEGALKAGHDLEPHVKDDFSKAGGQKPFDVRSELSSSFDVLSVINYKARREVRTTDSFVSDMQRAVALGPPGETSWPPMAPPSTSASASASASSSSDGGAPPPPPPRPAPHRAHPPAPAPASPPAPAPAPAPAPTPAPKPTSTGEVFNP